MIGHQQIIAARKAGLKPSAIFFEAGFDPLPWRFDFDNPERALDYGFYPIITVPDSELGRRLDLRFVAGCQTHIRGRQWTDSLTDFAEAVAKAGASSVYVCCADDARNTLLVFNNGEWTAYAD